MLSKESNISNNQNKKLTPTLESKKDKTISGVKQLTGTNTPEMEYSTAYSHFTSPLADPSRKNLTTFQLKSTLKPTEKTDINKEENSLNFSSVEEANEYFTKGPLVDLVNALALPDKNGLISGAFDSRKAFEAITILGPGQKAMVRSDNNIIHKLSTELENDYIIPVLKQLSDSLVWIFQNITRFQNLNITDKVLESFINTYPNEQVIDMLKDQSAQLVVLNSYTGNPFHWRVVNDKEHLTQKILTISADVTDFFINRGGATQFLQKITISSKSIRNFESNHRLYSRLINILPDKDSLRDRDKENLKTLYSFIINEGNKRELYAKYKEIFTIPQEKPTESFGIIQDEVGIGLTDEEAVLASLSGLSAGEKKDLRESSTYKKLIKEFKGDYNSIQEILNKLEVDDYYTILKSYEWGDVTGQIPEEQFKKIIPVIILNKAFVLAAEIIPNFFNLALELIAPEVLLSSIVEYATSQIENTFDNQEILEKFINKLPDTLKMSTHSHKNLFILFQNTANTHIKNLIFTKRFNIKLDSRNTSGKILDKLWLTLEKVPITNMAANDKLTDLKVYESMPSSGLAGLDYINLNLESTEANSLEELKDPGDKMEDLDNFTTLSIHEVGHTVDNARGYPQKRTNGEDLPEGGISTLDNFRKMKCLGNWKEYDINKETSQKKLIKDIGSLTGLHSDLRSITVKMVPDYPDIDNKAVKDMLYKALAYSFENKKSSIENGFMKAENSEDKDFSLKLNRLWQLIKEKKFIKFMKHGNVSEGNQPWENPIEILGDRHYHQGYEGQSWWSYLKYTRDNKLSKYSFRDPYEMFAEIYATFYTTDPPGEIIKNWHYEVYEWFIKEVDQGYSF